MIKICHSQKWGRICTVLCKQTLCKAHVCKTLHTLTWCACSWLKAAGTFFFSWPFRKSGEQNCERKPERKFYNSHKPKFQMLHRPADNVYSSKIYTRKKHTNAWSLFLLLQRSQLCHVIHHHLKLSFHRATELVVGHCFKSGCPQMFLTLQQGSCARGSSRLVTSSSPNHMRRMIPDHSSAPKLSC